MYLALSYKYVRLKLTLFAHEPKLSQQGNLEIPNLLLWLLDSSPSPVPTVALAKTKLEQSRAFLLWDQVHGAPWGQLAESLVPLALYQGQIPL